MTPKEAEKELRDMGLVASMVNDAFQIVKLPEHKHLATFVRAIKTLGAWSVDTDLGKRKVYITCGAQHNSLLFKVLE